MRSDDTNAPSTAHAGRPHGGHDSHLAHHFDAPSQQYGAGKLGMWLFIATELLMFGGLFCAYAVFRGANPEIFAWGSQFLDRTWGTINTMVLIFSSLTMALAVRAAQCNQRRQLVLFLSLTLICGVDFLVVKYIEYSHKFEEKLVWGSGFYEGEHFAGDASETVELLPGDATKGREAFAATCAACHGVDGEGIAALGPALDKNDFVGGLNDPGLLGFLQIGRAIGDARNTTGMMMPPRGGNPLLGDQDLMDIIASLRSLQSGTVAAGGDETEAAADPLAELVSFGTGPSEDGTAALVSRSVIPIATAAPAGLVTPLWQGPKKTRRAGLSPTRPPPEVRPPENAHLFFAIYFCMTGLHGIHVLVGIGLIAWLRARAMRGDFSGAYFTPVDFVGLYWHVVDVIWIFLFPLLYLI